MTVGCIQHSELPRASSWPLLTLKRFPGPMSRTDMARRTSDLLPCRDANRLLGSRTLSGGFCSFSITCIGICNHRFHLYPRIPAPNTGPVTPLLGRETEAP